MAKDPYKSGKPIVSVLFFIALMFGLIEGSVAATSYNKCDQISSGKKHWQVFPPQWVCEAPNGSVAGR